MSLANSFLRQKYTPLTGKCIFLLHNRDTLVLSPFTTSFSSLYVNQGKKPRNYSTIIILNELQAFVNTFLMKGSTPKIVMDLRMVDVFYSTELLTQVPITMWLPANRVKSLTASGFFVLPSKKPTTWRTYVKSLSRHKIAIIITIMGGESAIVFPLQ